MMQALSLWIACAFGAWARGRLESGSQRTAPGINLPHSKKGRAANQSRDYPRTKTKESLAGEIRVEGTEETTLDSKISQSHRVMLQEMEKLK